MPRPDTRVYRDIPALSFTEWDDPRRVRAALRTMEQTGQFQAAAMLNDGLRRDDRISTCLNTRIQGLLSLDVALTPATDQRKAQKVADQAQKLYARMFPRAQLAKIIASGLMLGIGLGENVWERVDGQWVPRLKFWHPQFIYWRWDTRSFWLITQDGLVEIPEDGDNGKWFVYCPWGYYLGWRDALINSLATIFVIRQLGWRDWARYSEKHGLPILGAVMPAGAAEEIKNRYLDLLNNVGSETLVELEQGADGNKFDLKVIEPIANTWEAFQGLKLAADESIACTILGQNLTTAAGSGKTGSLATAKVHENVKDDYLRFDALNVEEAQYRFTIEPWAAFNSDRALAPKPGFDTEPPDDLGKKAAQTKDLSAAVVAFKSAKAPVDVRKLLEEHQIPTLSEEEHAAQLEDEADRAAEARSAFAEKDDDEPTEEDKKDEPAPGEKLSATGSSSIRDGQAYVDKVVAASVARARVSMKHKLATIHQAVQLASSFDDLKRRLVLAFPHLKPDDFAHVLDRAQLMAELAGRSVVLESL